MARILVIEDDDPVRRMMLQALQRAGHTVDQARDGNEGVRLFRERPADVVVVDIYLPEKDGWNTLRALYDIVPGVPFVLVSGSAPLEGLRRGTPGVLENARQIGAYRVLRKPFRPQALLHAVMELLHERR